MNTEPTRDVLAAFRKEEASRLANESNLIKLRSTQRANRVGLYQVLGGSFDALPPTVVSTR